MRVLVECEEGGEARDNGCVGVAGTTHDDEKDVYLSTRPMASEGVGKEGVFISDIRCVV
jgi:hypothetical protein